MCSASARCVWGKSPQPLDSSRKKCTDELETDQFHTKLRYGTAPLPRTFSSRWRNGQWPQNPFGLTSLTAWHLPPCMKTVPVAPPFQITEGSRCSTRGFTLPREYQYGTRSYWLCRSAVQKVGRPSRCPFFSPSFSLQKLLKAGDRSAARLLTSACHACLVLYAPPVKGL